jgi:molybdopterin biosynthesis enzyme MoaB
MTTTIAIAGKGKTLVVNLPGNPQAVRESIEILGPLLPAAVALMKGEAPLNGINDPSWAAHFGKGRR